MKIEIDFTMTGDWRPCYKCSFLDDKGDTIERSFPTTSGELVGKILSMLDEHAREPVLLAEIKKDTYGGLHREIGYLPRLIELYNKAQFKTEPQN